MVSQTDPVVLRRRLRTELRALRRASKQTQEQAASAMDWSTSKLLRIENGEVRVAPSDVRGLAHYYGAGDKRVEQLVDMARHARADTWPDFKDVHEQASLSFFGYEGAASLMRIYNPVLIDGLLQTQEYAEEILKSMFGLGDEEVARRWEARARRQLLLERDDPPEIFCVLDEGTVRRHVKSPGVTRHQLEHLVELNGRDHTTIMLVPFVAGAYPGLIGPFTLLEFPEAQDDDVLYLERVGGDKVIRDESSVTVEYTERFFGLEKIALSKAATNELLEEIIAGLGQTKARRETEAPT